jgi:hypothetical protein
MGCFSERILLVRTVIVVLLIFAGSVLLPGCAGPEQGQGELLLVDFKPAQPLTYKFISERDITITVDTPSRPDKKTSHDMNERLELVIMFKPLDVKPFGLTTIEATCKSAEVTRKSFTVKGKLPSDAVESLAGKSFTFKVSPIGKIVDHSQFDQLVAEAGEKAFASSRSQQGRVKNPDMMMDFIAFVWHFWDPTASITSRKGVDMEDTWQTEQLVPLPVGIPAGRQTTYTLSEIIDSQEGRKATIESSYALTEPIREGFPRPYTGGYRLKGSLFAVLTNYKFTSLEGGGKTIFNVDTGTLEKDQQQYKVNMDASFILPLGDSVPTVTVDQKFSTELLENKSE